MVSKGPNMKLKKSPYRNSWSIFRPDSHVSLTTVIRMLVLTLCTQAGLAEQTSVVAAPPQHVLWTKQEPFPTPDQLIAPVGMRDHIVHRAGTDEYSFLHDSTIIAHRSSLLMSECCDTEKVACLSSCVRSRYTGTPSLPGNGVGLE